MWVVLDGLSLLFWCWFIRWLLKLLTWVGHLGCFGLLVGGNCLILLLWDILLYDD